MRKSVAVMLGSIAMLVVVGVLTGIDDGFVVLIVLPVICFLIGFFLLIYATAKEMNRRKVEVAVALAQQYASSRNAQLPPQRVTPVDTFTQRINTAEMVHPPSVTENTTRLLNEEPAPQR